MTGLAFIPGDLQSKTQLRERFIGELLTITGDTRRLWLPKPTDTTTSLDESKNGATLTHAATLAGRLSALGLGYAASYNGSSDYSTFPDAADLSFGNGTVDQAFSVLALPNVTDTAASRRFVGKFATSNREWHFGVFSDDTLQFAVIDESAGVAPLRGSNAAITQGSPHLFGSTYDGSGGATAMNGVTLYQDGLTIASTATNNASYVAMESLGADVAIGALNSTTQYLPGSVAMVLLCAGALTAHQMWAAWKLSKAFFNL